MVARFGLARRTAPQIVSLLTVAAWIDPVVIEPAVQVQPPEPAPSAAHARRRRAALAVWSVTWTRCRRRTSPSSGLIVAATKHNEADAERRGVSFVDLAAPLQDVDDRLDHSRVGFGGAGITPGRNSASSGGERELRPLGVDLLGRERAPRPGQPAEAERIRRREDVPRLIATPSSLAVNDS